MTIDPLGNRTTSVYDAASRVTTMIDPHGHRTTMNYDALGRVLTTKDALSGITTVTYDAVGNRLTLSDPDNNITTWTYDDDNRVASETSAISANPQTYATTPSAGSPRPPTDSAAATTIPTTAPATN